MPLVIPGITSDPKDKNHQWEQKLLGKKIGDSSDEVTFAKKELPQSHRVIKEGDFSTADHNPDRLNVHVGDDGTVRKVTHG